MFWRPKEIGRSADNFDEAEALMGNTLGNQIDELQGVERGTAAYKGSAKSFGTSSGISKVGSLP